MTRQQRAPRVYVWAVSCAFAALGAAWVSPAAAQAESTTFDSAPPPEAADEGDLLGMLAVCDQRLEECEQDALGVPFLGGAYLALWAILIAFSLFVFARQYRLMAEMRELRARLRAVTEERAER